MLCTRKSSIEWYTEISEKDQTRLSINRTMKTYYRKFFFKVFPRNIRSTTCATLKNLTSFNATRHALSNDMSKIMISKTHVDIRFGKFALI
jgi:hypothetical protein